MIARTTERLFLADLQCSV